MTEPQGAQRRGAAPMLGIDVGGTKVLGVVTSSSGEVLFEMRRETASNGANLVEDLASVTEELIAAAGGAAGAVGRLTLGVGVPGLVDREGVVRFAPNLSGANGTALRRELEARVGDKVSVHVDNDATSAAAGECAFGAGRGRRDVVFVTLGTGIGGGLLSNGTILRGSGNFSGEIGHVVIDPQGPLCGCGRRGCWERFASGSGLGLLARQAALAGRLQTVLTLAGGHPDQVKGEQVVQAAADGDGEAKEILAEFAWWLALGLANLANILDPDTIVIGGGLVRAGDLLLQPTREAFRAQLEGAAVRPEVDILPAVLGDRGGAIGAAVLGRVGPSGDITSLAEVRPTPQTG